MPKINSYPRITSPQNDDLLLISDQSEDFDSKSISLSQISGVVNSGKQNQITLTTLGTDGPATFVGDVLNIPRYTSSGGGSGSGTITDIATTAPITGGPITSIGTIGITQSSLTTDGYLSSTDFTTFNNKQSTSQKGAASGYAPLDANQKVPSANLPDSIVGAVSYQGTWNAQNNNPALPTPTTVQGHYYVTEVPGTYLSNVYSVGDWVISNGTVWEKVDNTQNVNSVFGRTGNVVADAGDYSTFYLGINDGYTNADVDAHLNNNGSAANNSLLSWTGTDYAWVSQGTQGFVTSVNSQTGTVTLTTDNITEGNSNLYYTDARVTANASVAANTAKVSFPGFGTAVGTALEGNTAVGQVQSLTTTGTSGAATLTAGVLNIPQYSGGGGGVGGSGTADYIPIWSTGSTIGNSAIYQDGTNIGINTTSVNAALDVNGNLKVENTSTAAAFYRQRSSTTGTSQIVKIGIYNPSGGIQDNFGGGIEFSLVEPTNTGIAARIYAVRSGGDSTGTLRFWTGLNGGVNTLNMVSTGQLELPGYGGGSFTGTATKSLAVNAGGDVIEIDVVPTDLVSGTTTGTGGISAVTEIRTLTTSEYAGITPAADVLYIVT